MFFMIIAFVYFMCQRHQQRIDLHGGTFRGEDHASLFEAIQNKTLISKEGYSDRDCQSP